MREERSIIEEKIRRGVGRVLEGLLSQKVDFEVLVEDEDGALSVGVDVIGVDRAEVESEVMAEMQRQGVRNVEAVDESVLDPTDGVRIYGVLA